MKKLLIVIAVVAAVAAYYALTIDQKKTVTGGVATYSSKELGFEFMYKTGPEGYVVDERIPADIGDYLRTLILFRTEDKESIDKGNVPVGGEGPATITISVFKNSKKQQAGNWAMTHEQESLYSLRQGSTTDTVVGGANAVRYMADGLYASENVVVAHGENVYVFTGMFMDQDSALRRDFAPLVDSVKFIPQEGQE